MADVKMVSLTIEGRPVTVPDGMSILEAAKTAGVLIPHYCYHPGLPVAGVCRMCLVEVEKFPKLAPACATSVMEGQVVHVHSPKALEARKGVLEFLLINHPLDCPICDQAGECELQDYTFAEGRADSRYREPKRFNPVEDFGGDVLYVQNRCILCTRCVRFMGDVAQEPVLNVSERGDRAFIGKAEGHDLTNPWAGNVIDLCPVGALLSKDFLNRARAWELDRAPTICTGCSQGCNAVAETRDNVPVRLKPRPNDAVNQFYMCEVGRQTYREFARRDRADQPMVRVNGALQVVGWDDALAAAARVLGTGRVVVLASPNLSNESLFLLDRLIARSNGQGMFRLERGDLVPLPGAPDLALREERAANAAGARQFGFAEVREIATALRDGDTLLVVGDSLDGIAPDAIMRAAHVVFVGTTVPPVAQAKASIVLPVTNTWEEEGTFTNLRGRVQRYLQARTAPGVARPSLSIEAVTRLISEYKPLICSIEINGGGQAICESLIKKFPWLQIREVFTGAANKKLHTDRIALLSAVGAISAPFEWEGRLEMSYFSKQTRKAFTGHDDCVMAMAIAFSAIDDIPSGPQISPSIGAKFDTINF